MVNTVQQSIQRPPPEVCSWSIFGQYSSLWLKTYFSASTGCPRPKESVSASMADVSSTPSSGRSLCAFRGHAVAVSERTQRAIELTYRGQIGGWRQEVELSFFFFFLRGEQGIIHLKMNHRTLRKISFMVPVMALDQTSFPRMNLSCYWGDKKERLWWGLTRPQQQRLPSGQRNTSQPSCVLEQRRTQQGNSTDLRNLCSQVKTIAGPLHQLDAGSVRALLDNSSAPKPEKRTSKVKAQTMLHEAIDPHGVNTVSEMHSELIVIPETENRPLLLFPSTFTAVT